MHVLAGAAAPLLAAGNKLEFDDALGAEADRDDAVEVLRRRRHEHADGLRQRCLDFLLHARADLLNLPALVGAAVVGDSEPELHVWPLSLLKCTHGRSVLAPHVIGFRLQ